MKKAKGYGILAVLAAVIVLGVGALLSLNNSHQDAKSSTTGEEATSIMVETFNAELVGQAQVVGATCANTSVDFEIAAEDGSTDSFACLVLFQETSGQPQCIAVSFTLVDGALPPAAQRFGQSIPLSECGA